MVGRGWCDDPYKSSVMRKKCQLSCGLCDGGGGGGGGGLQTTTAPTEATVVAETAVTRTAAKRKKNRNCKDLSRLANTAALVVSYEK